MEILKKNSDLFRRLKLYGFGVLLGSLIVSVVYKGKGCQLPSAAKMEELGWQKLEYTKQTICKMNCTNINESEILELLGTGKSAGKGKVNYDKSEVHNKPYPKYTIEGISSTGKNISFVIADCDTISKVISAIELNNKRNNIQNDSCDCPLENIF